MNRVIAAIEKAKATVAQRVKDGIITAEKVEASRKGLDMALDEYVLFQNLKSDASMGGKLTLDEAMTIYGYLGESLETFNRQPYEVKAILTKIYAELLDAKIRSKAA